MAGATVAYLEENEPAAVARIETLAAYPRLTEAMCRRGWPESRIRAVLGENWLRFLSEAID